MSHSYDPKIIDIGGKQFVSLKRYEVHGAIWHQFPPTDAQIKKLKVLVQNSQAHLMNRNPVGSFSASAETVAIWLTPEGVDPETKDHEAILAKVWELPHRFVVDVLVDIIAAGDDAAKKQ